MRFVHGHVFFVTMLLLPAGAVGQGGDVTAIPRMPWGAPEFQGIWLYQTSTPLERDASFGDKAVLTAGEAVAYVAQRHAEINEFLAFDLNADWPSFPGLTDRRTSLIIDPPNGRLPALTPAGRRRADTISYTASRGTDSHEDRERYERCIMGRSVPFVAPSWELRLQILQSPDYIVLNDEFGELRLIPLGGSASLPPFRQWTGFSRGRWEGDTLVIETAGFNDKWSFHGSGPRMRLVERFTRTDDDRLDYEFTVHDPESFARPWTASFPFTSDPGPLYEVACHEGNYSLPLILSGARARDRAEQPR